MSEKKERPAFPVFLASSELPDFSDVYLAAALRQTLGEGFDGEVSSAAIAKALLNLATSLRTGAILETSKFARLDGAILLFAMIACLQSKTADGWSFRLKGTQSGKRKGAWEAEALDFAMGQQAQERIEAGEKYVAAIKFVADQQGVGATRVASALAKFRALEIEYERAISALLSERNSE